MITVVGLEIHAELLTETKIFCGCENSFGKGENESVCPVCGGFPGALPSLNREAVYLAVKAGKALGCKINNYSAFDRKNYFYPDLPKAYQITQFEYPICGRGEVRIGDKAFGITRIHLEEDAGKLIHEGTVSRADYNRCGVPLIEIVTEPDFHSGEEAAEFVEEIAQRLKYCGVCDARLERGSLRADVNISVMPEGADKFGERTEIKNLNSYKAIKKAVEYEAARQAELISSGGKIKRETLRFDGEKTFSMRSKEETADYRYFPEPDLPPVFISDDEIEKITIPRLPHERIKEYTAVCGLSAEDARMLAKNKEFSDTYERAVSIYPDYAETAKLMLGSYSRELNRIAPDKITPEHIAKTVRMICESKISRNSANEIMPIMFETGAEPEDIAESAGMLMKSDRKTAVNAARIAIAENPKAVEDYKNGNKKSFGFLMGALMKCAGKGINPREAKDVLSAMLDETAQL